MDTRIMRCAIPVVALALLMGAGCASAQEDPGEVLHRNDCRLAHQILSRGQPDVKRGWALEVIGTCPGQAQQALVATWASPPLDEAELQRLYQASARILDGEVFAAAVRAAEDPTLPALVRLAGLGAAVTLVRPELRLDLENRRPVEGLEPLMWDDLWGTIDEPVQVDGDTPLPTSAEAMVQDLAQRLSGEGEERLLRDAAWWLFNLHGFGT